MAGALRVSSMQPEGINLMLRDGVAAFRTVSYISLHVIPRYVDDGWTLTAKHDGDRSSAQTCPWPRHRVGGGVRGGVMVGGGAGPPATVRAAPCPELTVVGRGRWCRPGHGDSGDREVRSIRRRVV